MLRIIQGRLAAAISSIDRRDTSPDRLHSFQSRSLSIFGQSMVRSIPFHSFIHSIPFHSIPFHSIYSIPFHSFFHKSTYWGSEIFSKLTDWRRYNFTGGTLCNGAVIIQLISFPTLTSLGTLSVTFLFVPNSPVAILIGCIFHAVFLVSEIRLGKREVGLTQRHKSWLSGVEIDVLNECDFSSCSVKEYLPDENISFPGGLDRFTFVRIIVTNAFHHEV